MNILCFSWRGPKHPDAGGAEISTIEHAKYWVKTGHKVTIFTSGFKDAEELEYIDGIRIIRRGSQFFSVHLAAFKWFVFDRKEQFDIVIDQFHGIPFFTPIFVKGRKLGFIHETTKEVWKLNQLRVPFNLLTAIVGVFLEPFIFKLFYRNVPFMTVSESTARDLTEWGIPKKQITVIYNGLTVPRMQRVFKREKKKTLIFLGALSKDKGIESALKVFQIIDKTEKDRWQFWVVGRADPSYLNNLRLQTRKLRIDKKIHLWGFVSEAKKFQLLSRAHIAINPSIREGWGLVVIEAAYVGTPTVAFDVPGLRDSIINNKTGIICAQNTVEDLAEKILELIEDAKKYKRISRNAAVWGRRFSWEKSAKLSLTLIENLLKA